MWRPLSVSMYEYARVHACTHAQFKVLWKWNNSGSLLQAFWIVFVMPEEFSVLENRECGRRDLLCWLCNTLYPQKLALISRTSGSRSLCIVHSWTNAMEFSCLRNCHLFFYLYCVWLWIGFMIYSHLPGPATGCSLVVSFPGTLPILHVTESQWAHYLPWEPHTTTSLRSGREWKWDLF
jgi:hypothetical protein